MYVLVEEGIYSPPVIAQVCLVPDFLKKKAMVLVLPIVSLLELLSLAILSFI